MTLVLTEISSFGVAMAADSAITVSSGRVYVGAQKLLPVPRLNAGISIWGKGIIAVNPADEWLQHFIEDYDSEKVNLWDFGTKLVEKLNQAFGGVISERMGIHLAGFDERNGTRGPVFYDIHNGRYHIELKEGTIVEVPGENPPLREFRLREDISPGHFPSGGYYLVRNGDYSIFSLLYDKLAFLFVNLQKTTGLSFPYPESLESRGEYLRFWIKTITEIYRLSNARRRVLPQPVTSGDASIGGPVTVLTISKEGITSFYTR